MARSDAAKRRPRSSSHAQRDARGVPRASRRAAMEEQGRGRVVDTERRVRRRRRCACGCAPRVRRGDGQRPSTGRFVSLAPIRQRGGKLVHAWAVEGDIALEGLASNTFTMEWPPRSGRMQSFPEVDRYGWFALDEARSEDQRSQRALLDELASRAEITQRGERLLDRRARAGRTSRATSRPSCSKTSVGHSLTR